MPSTLFQLMRRAALLVLLAALCAATWRVAPAGTTDASAAPAATTPIPEPPLLDESGPRAAWDIVPDPELVSRPGGAGASLQAAAATDCLGWPTRRVRYTSDGVIHLEGCGQTFTLTEVAQALADPAKLELVDPAAKIWLLKANLKVEEGATLNVSGGAGDAAWLRLRSDDGAAVWLRTDNGNLRFTDTRVTSWDATANAVDSDYTTGGRAYIAARSVLTYGRTTAPATACAVAGGSQEPYEARMDITRSELTDLGYKASEAWGVSWKVYYKVDASNPADAQPPGRELFALADIFGDVADSTFQHNYYGAYTFGAYCMRWTDNSFTNNVGYGLDPHDDSDYLTIQRNTFGNNGNHGLICAEFCDHLTITDNESYGNTHGIMLYQMVNDSLVQNNHSHDNRDSGVALYEAYNNTVRDNQLANNALAAIRLTVGASNNLIESNTLTGLAANASGAGYAVYTAGKGSDIPLSGNGRPANNTFRANQITGFKTPVLRIEEADGTRFESNAVTGPGTGFELILGTGNVVEATTFGGGLTTHVAVSGASGQAATATLRDSQIGQTLNVQLDSWSTLTLEDRRNLIWQLPVSGLATHAQPALSTLTLTTATGGTTEAFTTLDFAVRPGSGTADVRPTGWQTAAPFAKSWTASAAAGTVLNNSVGNLQPGACYAVSVDGTPLGQFMADGGGRIAFARTAGASPAQYSVAGVACDGSSPPTATPTSTPTATVTPAPSATQTPTSTPPGAPSPTSAPGTTATPTPTGTPVGAPRDQRTYLPEIVR